jgi:hypothetical protein
MRFEIYPIGDEYCLIVNGLTISRHRFNNSASYTNAEWKESMRKARAKCFEALGEFLEYDLPDSCAGHIIH